MERLLFFVLIISIKIPTLKILNITKKKLFILFLLNFFKILHFLNLWQAKVLCSFIVVVFILLSYVPNAQKLWSRPVLTQ